MTVLDADIVKRLRELLKISDLETTTEKQLRKTLEVEFKTDLTEKKPLIRQEVEKYLAEQGGDEEEGGAEEEEEEEEEEAPARGSALGSVLSEPLQEFLGVESMPRTQVVKKLWEYFKEHNLQDPKDKRKILLDDKLRKVFTPPLTMFNMNKQLSKHCKTADAVVDAPSKSNRAKPTKAAGDKRPAADKPKANSKAKKTKAEAGGGEEGGAKKPGNFNKPLKLSEDLAAWAGQEAMGRADLTKHFWEYVKDKGLQDPSNKQYILCDVTLKKLFNEDRIHAFSFQKLLAGHIIKD